MKIQYLGHSVFIIESLRFKCIIDPYISENPLCNIDIDEINGLTHIFITHGHGDHFGDCIKLARKNDAIVISNAEICCYLSNMGIKTHAMHIGGRYKFGFGIVKLTVAHHGSSIFDEGKLLYGGSPCGFIIKTENKCIYHAGDTGLTMDMQLLQNENIDLAMLPIGGNYTMDIEDALEAVKFIKPKVVVPMHYNTFDEIKADPKEFSRLNTVCETKILDYGTVMEI